MTYQYDKLLTVFYCIKKEDIVPYNKPTKHFINKGVFLCPLLIIVLNLILILKKKNQTAF